MNRRLRWLGPFFLGLLIVTAAPTEAMAAFTHGSHSPVVAPHDTDEDAPNSSIYIRGKQSLDVATGTATSGAAGRSGPAALYRLQEVDGCDQHQRCDPTYGPCKNYPKDKANLWRPFMVEESDDEGRTWKQIVGTHCVNTRAIGKRSAPLNPRDVYDEAVKELPKTGWFPQPGPRQELIVKPVIFVVRAAKPAPIFASITGHSITIKLAVQDYNWTFGDGSGLRTADPGRAFDSSLGPCTAASCDSYIHHSYARPGTYRVSLRVDWTARYRVGNGAWLDVPTPVGEPLHTTATPTILNLVSAHSELVTGN
jgi:hypothetical protein